MQTDSGRVLGRLRGRGSWIGGSMVIGARTRAVRWMAGLGGAAVMVAVLVASSRPSDSAARTLDELSHVRGAMWTARANLPFGPRPGRDTNVIMFMPAVYTPGELTRAIDAYKGRGYTHFVAGPVTGNDCYHGKYPCQQGLPTQERWDAYLDWIEQMWNAGLVPVYFAKPDNWEKPEHRADWDALDALYRQPRAQQLLKVVVPCGWEPDGGRTGWSNADFVSCLEREARVFPSALRYLHATCDTEVPRGAGDTSLSDADAWRRVSASIHGYLFQSCGYIDGPGPEPTPAVLRQWTSVVQRMATAFRPGGAWHSPTAWGDDRGLQFIAGEYAAYRGFWSDWPEKYARQLGDAAMCAGADGYLDGGSVSVPMTSDERATACR